MTPHEKTFWRWSLAAMALVTAGAILQLALPASYGIQPDWQTQVPGGQPFLVSQSNLSPNPSNNAFCSVSVVKGATILVLEGDMTSHTGLTANDSKLNTYTTASTADGTFGHIKDGAFDFSYWAFLATSNANGTDNISVMGTAFSTSAGYCAVIAAKNTTGFYYAPTQPVFVAPQFTPFPNSSVIPPHTFNYNYTNPETDYSGGLAINFGTAYISTQQPNFAISPVDPFIQQCFVGAPAACSLNSQNSGLVSYNFFIAHSIGGEQVTRSWSIQENSCTAGNCQVAGWNVLISFPTAASCLSCVRNQGGTPNTPQNLDIGTLINQTLPVWIYILIPSFLLGFGGVYFGAGIYGFVFGAIFGALVGVLGNQLEVYHLLVCLYGSVALLYSTRPGSEGMIAGMDDEPVELEGEEN